jgi:hypothetical protein
MVEDICQFIVFFNVLPNCNNFAFNLFVGASAVAIAFAKDKKASCP